MAKNKGRRVIVMGGIFISRHQQWQAGRQAGRQAGSWSAKRRKERDGIALCHWRLPPSSAFFSRDFLGARACLFLCDTLQSITPTHSINHFINTNTPSYNTHTHQQKHTMSQQQQSTGATPGFQLTSQNTFEDTNRSVNYLCGDCDSKVTLKRGDPIRCKECGYRVLYKQRTNRLVFCLFTHCCPFFP
jgi:DNA-directed RNA polymerase I, II, and III subunit RPABC4